MKRDWMIKGKQESDLEWDITLDDDGVNLFATDKDHNCYWVCCVGLSDGKLWLPNSLPNDIGLYVDTNGRIMVKEV